MRLGLWIELSLDVYRAKRGRRRRSLHVTHA